MSFSVGDDVLWVPSKDHAHDLGADGRTAWEFPAEDKAPPARGRGPFGRWQPEAPQGEPVRPRSFWPAKVTAVNEDGTCDLDIKAPNGCVTLHYAAQKHDEARTPGTFHEGE